MKKKMILLLTLLCTMTAGFAEDKVEVSSVNVPQGGAGSFDIVLKNSTEFVAFTMKLTLPAGVVYDGFVQGERIKGETVSDNVEGSVITLARLSAQNDAFTGNDGVLLTINVHTTEALKTGDEVDATLTELTFTTASEQESTLQNVPFTITIGEQADNRVLLDENDTQAPAAAAGVDVRVKRTITPGVWNTICLPFAMTAAQVTEVFGTGVKIGDFTSWSSEENDEGDITGITIGFTEVNAMEANHPYIIKVDTEGVIEEFTVDNVNVAPEAEPTVQVGTKKADRGYFIGTYQAGTDVPEDDLFLSGNNYWYSNGSTTMKGFRGFFELADVLTMKANTNSRVRLVFSETTGMGDAPLQNDKAKMTKESWYTIGGLPLNGEPTQKGAYINNGRVIIK